MFSRHRAAGSVAAALICCWLPAVAGAQSGSAPPPLPVAEVWGALVLAPPPGDAVLTAAYVPPFSGQLVSGLGTQTLSVSGSRRAGFELGAALFPLRLVGFEVRFEREDSPLAGTSSPHDVTLVYLARQPPAYELKQYGYERATAWESPDGSLTVSALSVNGVVRAAVAPRVRVAASGGMTIARVAGSLDSVGFTVFTLGGHSVLFPDTAKIGLRVESQTILGLNLGGAIDVVLGPRVALTAGYRWLRLGTAEPTVVARRVLNAREILTTIELSKVRETLAVESTPLELGHGRLLVGLKVTW